MDLAILNKLCCRLILGKKVNSFRFDKQGLYLDLAGEKRGSVTQLHHIDGIWRIYLGDTPIFSSALPEHIDNLETFKDQFVEDAEILLLDTRKNKRQEFNSKTPIIKVFFTNNWNACLYIDFNKVIGRYNSNLDLAQHYLDTKPRSKSYEIIDLIEAGEEGKHLFAYKQQTSKLGIYSLPETLELKAHVDCKRIISYSVVAGLGLDI